MTTDLRKLAEPFPASDVEWRVQSAGKKNDGVWARVLAYIANRAVMERLDEVVGPGNWRNEYRYEAGGAVLCGLSIRVEHGDGSNEWVTKWDGAENTDIEAVKGGLSGAMKRAGYQWGIGRYLYELEEGFAKVSENGKHYQAEKLGKYPAFKWDPPALPTWALPGGTGKPSGARSNGAGVKSATVESETATSGRSLGKSAPEARQQAAPAPAATNVYGVSEEITKLKLNSRFLVLYTTEELNDLIATRSTDEKYKKHVDGAKQILAARTDDKRVETMKQNEERQHAELPFH